MADQVDILLATFQGEKYLEELLQSILSQDYPYFRLMIRDDQSTDQTLSIIEAYQKKDPKRIVIIPSAHRLGVKGNFSDLIPQSQARYVMFSDQDDIWLPNKIGLTLEKMKEAENQHGSQMPLLIHTDLQVVSSDLTPIHPSFWKYALINPSLKMFQYLLRRNIATGCTMMANQHLLQLAYPIPSQSMMHDWWLALVAALFGKIEEIKEATILYRQHETNELGAKKFSLWNLMKKRFDKKHMQKMNLKYDQAYELIDRFTHLLNASQKEILHAFYNKKHDSFFKRTSRQIYDDLLFLYKILTNV